jgi:hypothetical protein
MQGADARQGGSPATPGGNRRTEKHVSLILFALASPISVRTGVFLLMK